MSALQYRGRAPDSDFHVVHKKYIDDRYATLKVDSAFINSAITAEIANQGLVTPSYVDAQDNLLAHKVNVDAGDATAIPVSALGAVNGVASLGPDIYVPSAQLPPLQTERPVFYKPADTYFLTGTATREVTQVNPREFKAATLTIPDLGYPYTPICFAIVRGGSLNGPNSTRALGTGCYAQITILRSDNVRFGYTLTTGQKAYDTFTCFPAIDPNTPQTPLTGSNTFDLWFGMQTGTTYTFSAVGLLFYALVMPAL